MDDKELIAALVEVLAKTADAIERADPRILIDTLWMPDDESPSETVVDYIRAAIAKATGA